jgi:hypothetical protein
MQAGGGKRGETLVGVGESYWIFHSDRCKLDFASFELESELSRSLAIRHISLTRAATLSAACQVIVATISLGARRAHKPAVRALNSISSDWLSETFVLI